MFKEGQKLRTIKSERDDDEMMVKPLLTCHTCTWHAALTFHTPLLTHNIQTIIFGYQLMGGFVSPKLNVLSLYVKYIRSMDGINVVDHSLKGLYSEFTRC